MASTIDGQVATQPGSNMGLLHGEKGKFRARTCEQVLALFFWANVRR
jgi:hypothetical protein